MYTPDKIPDPYTNLNAYDKISAVDPQVLAYPKIEKMQNVETHPIEVKPGYPYVYIALHYTGGCFVLYGISAHYYQCPSKALPKSLIQLPRTMAPPKGWKQVKGLCAPHAQPKTNADDLYGYCDAEGKWREDSYKAVCHCEAGYHDIQTRSGTECQGIHNHVLFEFSFRFNILHHAFQDNILSRSSENVVDLTVRKLNLKRLCTWLCLSL